LARHLPRIRNRYAVLAAGEKNALQRIGLIEVIPACLRGDSGLQEMFQLTAAQAMLVHDTANRNN